MPLYEDIYLTARKQARRYLSDHPGEAGFLRVLSDEIGKTRPAGEYPLGLFEIPLKKIIGTCSDSRRASFAGNFLPLWAAKSEPAIKWMSLFRSHEKEGLQHPVLAHEYLGYYYILEGHKRVSVLRSCDAYSVSAEITRVLPAWDSGNDDIAVLYEYYRLCRNLPVRHMWFSRAGRLTSLLDEAKLQSDERTDAYTLLGDSFSRFRKRFHEGGYGAWPMTTGDAFYFYVQVFGLPSSAPINVLRENIAACSAQWRQDLSIPDGTLPPPSKGSALSHLVPVLMSVKPRTQATFAFAFEGTAESNETTRLHAIACRRLSLLRPDTPLRVRDGLPPDDSAWTAFEELLSETPRYLFVPSPSHMRLAWRASLLYPDTKVMHMHPEHPSKRLLATCWGRQWEPTLLAGALAGLLTRTFCIALVTAPDQLGIGQARAFAFGVSLTNPHARLLHYRRENPVWQHIRAGFAVSKADVAWLPPSADPQLASRSFPGVFACLCTLSTPDASPLDVVAAVAWHWSAFYLSLLDPKQQATTPDTGVAAIKNAPSCSGLAQGLLDLHLNEMLLTSGTRQMLGILRRQLEEGSLDAPDSQAFINNLSELEL